MGFPIHIILYDTNKCESLPNATLHALGAHSLKHVSVVSQNACMFYLHRSYNNIIVIDKPSLKLFLVFQE